MKKIIYLMLLLMISTVSMNAQVVIGSDANPHGGAILDLSTVSGKNLGLLLPKIELTSVTSWSPALGVKTEGLLVYNTGTALPKGAYVWTVDDEHPDGFWAKI